MSYYVVIRDVEFEELVGELIDYFVVGDELSSALGWVLIVNVSGGDEGCRDEESSDKG
jgi:hypothetical protein